METTGGWLERIMKRLPLTQPGTLVASEEGVGVFLGDWTGGSNVYGVKRGNKVLLDLYPTGNR